MPELDPLLLSRIQFAFTISFHILFPSFTIGLAAWLVVLEALWLKTGKAIYLDIAQHWTKIFAVSFGMGVVSGVVLSYEFGTNWSELSRLGGNVIGPLMSYEVLTAFFLEAGFLGVMLFGLERVGHKLHFLATLMVAVGTLISAFWILSANSWMQTPTGYAVNADGQFVAADWFKVIFNPSFPYRLVHMVLAAYLTTALVVGAVGAYHLLRDSHLAGTRPLAYRPGHSDRTTWSFHERFKRIYRLADAHRGHADPDRLAAAHGCASRKNCLRSAYRDVRNLPGLRIANDLLDERPPGRNSCR